MPSVPNPTRSVFLVSGSGLGYVVVEFYVPMKLLTWLTSIAVLLSPAFGQEPAQQRMVLIISLDGFPAHALDDPKLPIPTLRHLIENGVSARMTTVNPTITWPNHTTMVTGVSFRSARLVGQRNYLTNGRLASGQGRRDDR